MFEVLLVHVRLEVWLAPRTMLAGVRTQVTPAGETEGVRPTVPAKPLSGATVMVEVAPTPTLVATLVGTAAKLKSWTV